MNHRQRKKNIADAVSADYKDIGELRLWHYAVQVINYVIYGEGRRDSRKEQDR